MPRYISDLAKDVGWFCEEQVRKVLMVMIYLVGPVVVVILFFAISNSTDLDLRTRLALVGIVLISQTAGGTLMLYVRKRKFSSSIWKTVPETLTENRFKLELLKSFDKELEFAEPGKDRFGRKCNTVLRSTNRKFMIFFYCSPQTNNLVSIVDIDESSSLNVKRIAERINDLEK